MRIITHIVLPVLLFLVVGNVHAATPPTLQIPDEYTRTVDQLAFYIDSHCTDDKQKIEALYTWITHNMSYNLYTTFSSRNEEYSESKELEETLRTREGVCRQFALLFTRVAEKMAIPAFVVNGYNKSKTGVIMTEPHDWCAAKIDAKWYLYDPTFDMGYVNSSNQFISRPAMQYCHALPQEFIKNHMPYDPIWQLLDYPYTYEEFDNATFRASTSSTYHFNDSIISFVRSTPLKQLIAAHQRVKQNGQANRLVDYYVQLTEANISVYRQKETYDVFNAAVRLQNQGFDHYDAFMKVRRTDFETAAKDEAKIRKMLQQAKVCGDKAEKLISTLSEIPDTYVSAIDRLKKSVQELLIATNANIEFVESYYKASASQRRALLRRAGT